ncbi:MAG: hypothetical protein ACUVUR_05210, partial [bacterium]
MKSSEPSAKPGQLAPCIENQIEIEIIILFQFHLIIIRRFYDKRTGNCFGLGENLRDLWSGRIKNIGPDAGWPQNPLSALTSGKWTANFFEGKTKSAADYPTFICWQLHGLGRFDFDQESENLPRNSCLIIGQPFLFSMHIIQLSKRRTTLSP